MSRIHAVDKDVGLPEGKTEDLEDAGEVAGETRGDGEGHFWLGEGMEGWVWWLMGVFYSVLDE